MSETKLRVARRIGTLTPRRRGGAEAALHFPRSKPTSLRVVLATLAVCVAAVIWLAVGRREAHAAQMTSTAKVDLQRYRGTRYVIAKLPYFAENGKVATRDVYRLDSDSNVTRPRAEACTSAKAFV